jgi:hypothetical protein
MALFSGAALALSKCDFRQFRSLKSRIWCSRLRYHGARYHAPSPIPSCPAPHAATTPVLPVTIQHRHIAVSTRRTTTNPPKKQRIQKQTHQSLKPANPKTTQTTNYAYKNGKNKKQHQKIDKFLKAQ